VTAKDLEAVIDPACTLLDLEASTFDECLNAFEPIVWKHRAVLDSEILLEQVRLRESTLSTASGEGVAFPHPRTNAVSRFFLAIGRSRKGILFPARSPLVYLIFLIGTPPNAIAEYLGCVAWLAGRVRDPETRQRMLVTEIPEAFAKIVTAAAS
jgi:mannitol/fructose-specific phosphotransferase system IIA component (Ntr-type)